jgi:hypothetical protein
MKSIAEPKSQARWNAENTVCVNLRVNRNQDPELFELLTKAENKSAVIRELIAKGMAAKAK